MIARFWASIQANSPQAKRRELRAIVEEICWLEREHERLAARRDELVTELRLTELRPELKVVGNA